MSSYHNQASVSRVATCSGVGLHTGLEIQLSLHPAPVDTGIVFVRRDIANRNNQIQLSPDRVVRTRLNTEIANPDGVSVATIEHLMAALAALRIDNVRIELDGPEVPIMDGSAVAFVDLIDQAGRCPQALPRKYIEILKPIAVEDGTKKASLLPCPRFEIGFEIAFDTPVIGHQFLDMPVTEASFRTQLSAARTFGFLHEVQAMRAAGLALGGSLDNAIVIDGDHILNPEGLRMPDEFVRHKALDAFGDLYVLGYPIIGRLEAYYAGHALNNRLVRALQAQENSWRLVCGQEMAKAETV